MPKQSCPLRTVTQSAAQVASQQSLILRTGAGTIPYAQATAQTGSRDRCKQRTYLDFSHYGTMRSVGFGRPRWIRMTKN